jgi:triosephosphate isomerase
MRTPLMAANWKMNKTIAETSAFFDAFIPAVKDAIDDIDIIIAPPYTSLAAAAEKTRNSSIRIAGQNVYFEEKGAFTGEISATMLIDAGCEAVIIGHSERRHILKETDDVINKKIKAALDHGLMVLFCIGELLAEREAGKTNEVLQSQIYAGLADISAERAESIVIAYEPVWAIGTGKTATAEVAQESHDFIRKILTEKYGQTAQTMRILYGGSVTPDNVKGLMACPDIDGTLVGGASLKADSFAQIVLFNR